MIHLKIILYVLYGIILLEWASVDSQTPARANSGSASKPLTPDYNYVFVTNVQPCALLYIITQQYTHTCK